jgi:hypothetical protein
MLADDQAELGQFSVDAGSTPEWVLTGKFPDQLAFLGGQPRAATPLSTTLPAPVGAEACPVPLDDGIGLDHED